MIKSELKTGMIVKLRTGDSFLVVKNAVYGKDGIPMSVEDELISHKGNMNLDGYNEDLTHQYDSNCFDIMEVYYTYFHRMMGDILKPQESQLIWRRPQPKHVTMKEIADKFGVRESEIVIVADNKVKK